MAHSPELWAEAKVLYEAGKSAREITAMMAEKQIKLPFSSIATRAIREGWKFAICEPLIKEKAHLINELSIVNAKCEQQYNKTEQIVVESVLVMDELKRLRVCNNLVDGTLSLAQKMLKNAHQETDPRIQMQMGQLVIPQIREAIKMTGVKHIKPEQNDTEKKKKEGVIIYIPDNGRD